MLLLKMDVPHDCSAEWIEENKTKTKTRHSKSCIQSVLFVTVCRLETKQSPLSIIMEKLPDKKAKKYVVVNLQHVCKKPVRDCRGGN